MTDNFSRITHCTFTTKDYDRMQKFYGETLGLKKLFKIDYDERTINNFRAKGYCGDMKVGEEWLSYYKVVEKEFIELFSVPYCGENDTSDQGFHHVCLLVEDVREAARDLREKGVELLKGPAFTRCPRPEAYSGKDLTDDGFKSFFIQDPEGNNIEIMQDSESEFR